MTPEIVEGALWLVALVIALGLCIVCAQAWRSERD